MTEKGDAEETSRAHLRGLIEALIFASDAPITTKNLAKLASASVEQVCNIVDELRHDYHGRGFHLDEVGGGLVFRTNVAYAPFIRDLTNDKPARLSRAQIETLAIVAYRQPITRPEIDDVRGVDSGPVLKVLLERDLVRILGKRDEPGRPIIYGTTNAFLEFFGLGSLKDLPTLREFTELTDESRRQYEDELGDSPNDDAADPGSDDAGSHEP
ncbi:MAG: SMC-Scp complex subunit ScpB [Polyangiaceae bacterium]|nr:SMC-Scp complex subunit ScpB [Polyangiaceae bacterium]